MHHENKRISIKDALFPIDTFEESGTWVKRVMVDGKELRFSFPTKPLWLYTMEKSNEILLKNPNPTALRKAHDKLFEIASKSDNIYNRCLHPKALDQYLSELHSPVDLHDLHHIYRLKLRDEQKSCAVGGSMPSSACSTLRRLSEIVAALERRIAQVQKEVPKERALSLHMSL